nr:hypothetical protein CFP56_62692 [Quercus suber]
MRGARGSASGTGPIQRGRRRPHLRFARYPIDAVRFTHLGKSNLQKSRSPLHRMLYCINRRRGLTTMTNLSPDDGGSNLPATISPTCSRRGGLWSNIQHTLYDIARYSNGFRPGLPPTRSREPSRTASFFISCSYSRDALSIPVGMYVQVLCDKTHHETMPAFQADRAPRSCNRTTAVSLFVSHLNETDKTRK